MMGDAMLSSLYREEIFAKTQESFALNESNMSKGFSVFHDYLGLANLVVASRTRQQQPQPAANSFYSQQQPMQQHQSQMAMDPLPSPTGSSSGSSLTSESMDFNTFFESQVSRKRINSLESDARSESSISSRNTNESGDLYLDLQNNNTIHQYHHNITSDSSPVITSVPFLPPPPPAAAAMMMGMHDEGLQSIEPILANLKTPVGSSRVSQMAQQKQSAKNNNASKVSVCVFCRNNGESREFYSSHTLKDSEGATTCPILRAYTCPLCKANGDQSHTIKYCPKYTPKAATPITGPAPTTRMGLF